MQAQPISQAQEAELDLSPFDALPKMLVRIQQLAPYASFDQRKVVGTKI
jgi:hypothetical protein